MPKLWYSEYGTGSWGGQAQERGLEGEGAGNRGVYLGWSHPVGLHECLGLEVAALGLLVVARLALVHLRHTITVGHVSRWHMSR